MTRDEKHDYRPHPVAHRPCLDCGRPPGVSRLVQWTFRQEPGDYAVKVRVESYEEWTRRQEP